MEVRLAQHGPTLVLWNLPQDLLPRGCPEAVPRLPLESAYCLKVRLDFASRLKPSWESASGRASQMLEKFAEENGCFNFTFAPFFDDEAASWRKLELGICDRVGASRSRDVRHDARRLRGRDIARCEAADARVP